MIETLIGLGYLGLFIASFIAATILPFNSDVVIVALILAGLDHHICVVIATAGGTLGGLTNYYLGRLGKTEWIEKHSKIRRERVAKMEKWLKGKGPYMAVFSWIPVFGNLLVVALGYLRSNVWIVGLFLLLGMFVRYVVVVFLTLQGKEFVF